MDDPLDDETNPLVKLASLAVLGLGLGTLFLGYEWFWLVFAVGFAVVVPIVKVVTEEFPGVGLPTGERGGADDRGRDRRRSDPSADSDSTRDALDTLRDRYARGDLSEAEFERKVEALLGTETPESARRYVERDAGDREYDVGGRERETETERGSRETGDADLETDDRVR